MQKAEFARYLDEFLEAQDGEDYGPNGLQVEGRTEIRRVVTGVSACEELFERARDSKADAVIVHHGIFWRGVSPVLTGYQYRRVRILIEGGINLLAYHLPLDRHADVGNNVQAARRLGLTDIERFGKHGGIPIGFQGRFPEPLSATAFRARCGEIFGQDPTTFMFGPDPLRTVGIISGGAQTEFHQAIAAGLDAYITGEASEWVMNVARESRTHFVAAGHYATERLGIQALGDHLVEKFGLDIQFVDIPNPV